MHLNAKTFCEFFAGLGLVREGLEPSGWQCVYANDICAQKQLAYQARFGPSREFHLADISNIPKVVERIVDRPFLATASFPCVDLSVAGHYRDGLDGKQSSTFFSFINAIQQLGPRQPHVVMLENVVGFLTSREGKDFAIAAQELAQLGYWLDVFILDAKHFTPQSRPRVFVIGVLPELRPTGNDQNGFLCPSELASWLRPVRVKRVQQTLHLSTGWLQFPTPPPPTLALPLAEVIALDDGQDWWPESEVQRHYAMMSSLHRKQVDLLISLRKTWVGTIFRRIRQSTMRAEVRFDGLAGCLRTPKGGSAKQIVIAIQRGALRMRWMSPREYARLQGTPNYPLVGTTIQQLWGFADAVCVPAIHWIDQHILSPLYDAHAPASKPRASQALVSRSL